MPESAETVRVDEHFREKLVSTSTAVTADVYNVPGGQVEIGYQVSSRFAEETGHDTDTVVYLVQVRRVIGHRIDGIIDVVELGTILRGVR